MSKSELASHQLLRTARRRFSPADGAEWEAALVLWEAIRSRRRSAADTAVVFEEGRYFFLAINNYLSNHGWYKKADQEEAVRYVVDAGSSETSIGPFQSSYRWESCSLEKHAMGKNDASYRLLSMQTLQTGGRLFFTRDVWVKRRDRAGPV